MTAEQVLERVAKVYSNTSVIGPRPDHGQGRILGTPVYSIVTVLESAGLRIVDAELHQALIEAVRAKAWRLGEEVAFLHLPGVNPSPMRRAAEVEHTAYARAVELLERGE